jgi:phosphoribosylaminoimidazolecarboxamide formyltransferase/IMP cyclohydrolase
MVKTFYEIVIAPDFDAEALDILQKRQNLRILRLESTAEPRWDYRRVSGGLLIQDSDVYDDDDIDLKVVTKRAPTDAEVSDLRFAWHVAKLVKSNAIVLARDRTLIGMGAGQPNRHVSVHLAARAAGEKARGSVLASDAFFPFPDGLELGIQAGITAAIEPGGSIRDQEVIEAADRAGIAMVFTGIRHFRH